MKTPDPSSLPPIALAELRRGESGVVNGLNAAALGESAQERDSMLSRLRDLGFIPGARCEVIARMWFGGDPVAVRIGGSTFALRRVEAAAVRVTRVAQLAAA
ncbi:MAG: FeoA family protein [Pseudomonadota bacterium]